MKKTLQSFILTIITLSICNCISAQDFIWSKNITGSKNLLPRGIVTDSDNNTYITGTFKTTNTFDDVQITSNGHFDIFLAKYSSKGELQWAINNGGTKEDVPWDIFIDSSNMIYIVGGLSDSAIFISSNGNNSDTIYTSSDKRDGYIAKYNSSGELQWVKNILWGAGENLVMGVAVSNNSILITGEFSDTAYTLNDTLIAKGKTDLFYAKYNIDGAPEWINHIECSSEDSRLKGGVHIISDTGLVVGGFFYDTLTVGGETLISKGSSDIVLIQAYLNGNQGWIRQAGGVGLDRCNDMVLDKNNMIYITGRIAETAQFDSLASGDNLGNPLVSNGGDDIFIACYSSTGNLQWNKNVGGSYSDIAYGLDVADTNVFITGFFTEQAIFGEDTLNSKTLSDMEPFYATFNNTGDIKSAISFESNLGTDRGLYVHIDNNENAIIYGEYYADTLFIEEDTLVNYEPNKSDGFLTKIGHAITVKIPVIQAIQCNTAKIPVYIDFSSEHPVSALELNLTGFNNNIILNDIVSTGSLTENANWTFSFTTNDTLWRIVAAGEQDINETGIIFWLDIELPYQSPDTIDLLIDNIKLNEYTFPVNALSGKIIISNVNSNIGDVSLNNSISAYDASLILKYLVDYIELSCIQLKNADFSSDYTVSSLDAYYIIQHVTDNLAVSSMAAKSMETMPTVTMNKTLTAINNEIKVPIYIEDTENITAFYQEITYDNNVLELTSIKWNNDLSDFNVLSNNKNGRIKIAAAKVSNDAYKSNISCKLIFRVKENVKSDQTQILLDKLHINETVKLEKAGSSNIMLNVTDIKDIKIEQNNILPQNSPNPFSSETTIKVVLPQSENISLNIYNINGQLVKQLFTGYANQGINSFTWNGSTNNNNELSTGTYYYKLETSNDIFINKLLYIRP